MNARSRGIIIGMSGFYAGGLIASLLPLDPWPKAGVVVTVSVVVSVIALLLIRPAKAGDVRE
jgi:hypothetical protein